MDQPDGQQITMFEMGRMTARLARGEEDLRRARQLRYRAFIDRAGCEEDADAFDASCHHILIEDTGTLVATARFQIFKNGSELRRGYSAQFYDLSAFERFHDPIMELGRFCLAPDYQGYDALRLAWAYLTYWADLAGAGALVGCSSFAGAKAELHLEALTLLRQAHLAPPAYAVGVKAAEVYPYGRLLQGRALERMVALRQMPPLLRSYLQMGGWVSDHAVIDHALNTLHVFTCVDRAHVPEERLKALRKIGPLHHEPLEGA